MSKKAKDTEKEIEEIIEDIDEAIAEEENLESAEQSEVEALKSELATVKDNLLRTAAEYDNFRKRTAREKIALATDIKAMTVEELLPILDNLERAMAISEETSAADVLKGVEMVYSQTAAAFEKLGVETIGEIGEVFDPNIHHAVSHIDSEDFEENTISQVFQKGYKIGDKVIRAAMVQVAN